MPKPTFFNLPEGKRKAIIDLAIEEFADHDYRNASISRLVAKAGIAKGSIYQYFDDKRDLFMYLVDLVTQEKMAVLKQMPPEPGMDFFGYVRWLAAAGARVTFSHPRLAKVGYRAFYGDLPFHDEVVAKVREAANQYLGDLVRKAIADGDVDPSVDPEMAVFVVNTLIAELGNFIVARSGIDVDALGRGGELTFDFDAVEETFDQLVNVLQFGMGNGERFRGAAADDGLKGKERTKVRRE